MSLCECGCGGEASPGRRFINGHNCKGKNNPMYGVEPWCKGLTKETDDTLRKGGKKQSKTKKKFFASEEGKLFAKEMSKTKTEFFASEEGQQWLDENYRGKNHPTYGKEPWNFGLTKEIDNRVKKYGESSSKTKKEFFQTEEGKLYAKNHSLIMHEKWQDPKYVEKVTNSWSKKPTQPEEGIDDIIQLLFHNEYKYNGNYDLGISIGRKIPDFVNVNGKKKAIDLFGDYWHKGEDPQVRINLFKECGWDLLVIWEHELKDRDAVIQKILNFHGIEGDYVLTQKTLDMWIDKENNQN